MKKISIIMSIVLLLFVVIYLGIIRSGFSYYTGIGTPYNYFAARKATHDGLLVMYSFSHDELYVGNIDSLEKLYGFTVKTCYSNISPYVLNMYNTIIKKEIHKRIGKVKWEEYIQKRDSLQKKYLFEFYPYIHNDRNK